MPSALMLVSIVVGSCVGTFFLFYKFWWEKRIDRNEVIDLLRSKGIADKPETIVRQYYKSQQLNKSESEVKKLTKQYARLQKEFFLTMYENIHKGEKQGDQPNET